MYTGFIGKGAGDKIFWTSNDNSCVAPGYGNVTAADNQFELPLLYSIGAETGYIEIISMGSPLSETSLSLFPRSMTLMAFLLIVGWFAITSLLMVIHRQPQG